MNLNPTAVLRYGLKDHIMTVPQDNQVQQNTSQAPSDKELNFRALQQKYEKQLEQERQARMDLEKRLSQPQHDDDDSDEPYVDHKKLNKKLQKFGQETMQQTQVEIKQAVNQALYEERKQNWLKNNGDFYDVMQHAQKFAEKDPELAETILEMPESFERQKLVYKNIKALGLHKPQTPEPSIQQKIDANRRNPYYQPSGVSSAPYASQGDFSASGQKNAYDKLQELKRNLRI
jgi:hypothetical protein